MQQRLADQLFKYYPFHPLPHTSYLSFLVVQLFNKGNRGYSRGSKQKSHQCCSEAPEGFQILAWYKRSPRSRRNLAYPCPWWTDKASLLLVNCKGSGKNSPAVNHSQVFPPQRDTPAFALTNHYPALPAVPSPCQEKRDEAFPSLALSPLPSRGASVLSVLIIWCR